MASSRKKLDEKHLKILRELVSNPQNRQCFDCHQRGPTYVNMTIGSFVCTSCSGLLRGLTPPHRVKSISMATFSPEDIGLISARGNEYCRKIWLGLYEPGRVAETRDEQGIKDFMVAKYEKKRYYLDPSMANINGIPASSTGSSSASSAPVNPVSPASNATTSNIAPPVRPLTNLVSSLTLPSLSSVANSSVSSQNAFTPDGSSSGFLVDFGSAPPVTAPAGKTDPFGMPTSNTKNTSNNSNFANFENNPIFDSSNGMPPSGTLPSSQSFPVLSRKSSGGGGGVLQPPPEDRYAALKDLDSLMKSQNTDPCSSNDVPQSQSEWGQQPQSSSLPWAQFGNAAPPSSNFPTSFPQESGPTANGAVTSNPFTGSSNPWNTADSASANPFRSGRPAQPENSNSSFMWGGSGMAPGINGNAMNGFHSNSPSLPSSQSLTFPTKSWTSESTGNPFTLGSSSSSGNHSSNPFL